MSLAPDSLPITRHEWAEFAGASHALAEADLGGSYDREPEDLMDAQGMILDSVTYLGQRLACTTDVEALLALCSYAGRVSNAFHDLATDARNRAILIAE